VFRYDRSLTFDEHIHLHLYCIITYDFFKKMDDRAYIISLFLKKKSPAHDVCLFCFLMQLEKGMHNTTLDFIIFLAAGMDLSVPFHGVL